LDTEDEVLVNFTPKGETVNSQNYCDLLKNETEVHDPKISAVQNWLKTQTKTFFWRN
jgi:hypothetical protein